jgi:hypothetical protein
MRVLLSTYDSRGGVEPLAGLAVRLRELAVELIAEQFDDPHRRGDAAAALLLDAVSRERPPVPA